MSRRHYSRRQFSRHSRKSCFYYKEWWAAFLLGLSVILLIASTLVF